MAGRQVFTSLSNVLSPLSEPWCTCFLGVPCSCGSYTCVHYLLASAPLGHCYDLVICFRTRAPSPVPLSRMPIDFLGLCLLLQLWVRPEYNKMFVYCVQSTNTFQYLTCTFADFRPLPPFRNRREAWHTYFVLDRLAFLPSCLTSGPKRKTLWSALEWLS